MCIYRSEREAARQLIVNSLSLLKKNGAKFSKQKTHQEVGREEQQIHQDVVLRWIKEKTYFQRLRWDFQDGVNHFNKPLETISTHWWAFPRLSKYLSMSTKHNKLYPVKEDFFFWRLFFFLENLILVLCIFVNKTRVLQLWVRVS